MHVAKVQIASLKITSEFVRVNRAQLVIHFWAVFQFNIVALTTSVRREQFAKLVFVARFVHRIVTASLINYVYKVFVNRLVTTIPLVLISNSVKTTSAHKRFDAERTTIVCSMSIVLLIRMADPNVKMLAMVEFFVEEMQNVWHVIIMLCVHVSLALLMMDKVVAKKSNVKRTKAALRIVSVKRTFVNWSVKLEENRAVKRPFVRPKTIVQFAIVNRATVEIHMNIAMQLTIAVMHLVAPELCVQIVKERSIVLAEMAM